jgi:hypothetical protein
LVGAGLTASSFAASGLAATGFAASGVGAGLSCAKAGSVSSMIAKKTIGFMELPCFPETIPEEYPFLLKAAN